MSDLSRDLFKALLEVDVKSLPYRGFHQTFLTDPPNILGYAVEVSRLYDQASIV